MRSTRSKIIHTKSRKSSITSRPIQARRALSFQTGRRHLIPDQADLNPGCSVIRGGCLSPLERASALSNVTSGKIDEHRLFEALFADDHQRSSKSRFSRTALNLSRILGLNDLSSASVSKPSSINSEGMDDKTLMTAPR